MESFKCKKGAPWSEEVYYTDRLFVIAEVDDTFIYHIHLGEWFVCQRMFTLIYSSYLQKLFHELFTT
jgi:hypothetical protein